MWQEVSRLFSGKSERAVTVVLNVVFLYLYVKTWILGGESGLSWLIVHVTVVSTLTYVALTALFPRRGKTIRQLFGDFDERLSVLFAIVSFGWVAYLLAIESDEVLVYAVSVVLGVTFLYDSLSDSTSE